MKPSPPVPLKRKPRTEDEMRLDLRRLCEADSMTGVAKRFGLSSAFICDVLHARRNVTSKLAGAMGYQRVVTFTPLNQERPTP